MTRGTGMTRLEERLSVASGGLALDIIASQAGDGQWTLAIRNSYGVSSIWHDCFATAEDAIAAGLQAIEREGARAFMDMEGFDYLLE